MRPRFSRGVASARQPAVIVGPWSLIVIDVSGTLHHHREAPCVAVVPRWVRCVRDQWLHRLADATDVAAVEGGQRAVCGRVVSPARHTFSSESRGLCEDCVAAGRAS